MAVMNEYKCKQIKYIGGLYTQRGSIEYYPCEGVGNPKTILF